MGRAQKIRNPYLDRAGVRMDQGGGALLLKGDDRRAGLGHNSVHSFNGKDYIVFHAYDSQDDGRPKLRIEESGWDHEGWRRFAHESLKTRIPYLHDGYQG